MVKVLFIYLCFTSNQISLYEHKCKTLDFLSFENLWVTLRLIFFKESLYGYPTIIICYYVFPKRLKGSR